jgi:hypothetical protein
MEQKCIEGLTLTQLETFPQSLKTLGIILMAQPLLLLRLQMTIKLPDHFQESPTLFKTCLEAETRQQKVVAAIRLVQVHQQSLALHLHLHLEAHLDVLMVIIEVQVVIVKE